MLLTELLANEATPAWMIPSPSSAEAGAIGGSMGPPPTYGLPLQTCTPLDEARYAIATRTKLNLFFAFIHSGSFEINVHQHCGGENPCLCEKVASAQPSF